MAEYDGSIRIGVLMDTEKVKKKLDDLQSKLIQQTREVDSQAKAVSRLQAQYDKLMSGSKVPKGAGKLVEELAQAQAEAARIDAQIQELQKTSASGEGTGKEDSKIAKLQAELAASDEKAGLLDEKLKQLGISPDVVEKALGLQQQIGAANSELERMQAEAQDTQARITNLSEASQSWPVKLARLVTRAGASIANAGKASIQAIGGIQKRISGLGREKGFDRAGKSAGRFGQRLKSIVAGALFFNIISRGLTALTKQLGAYLTANKSFSDALSGIKSNLLTAFQPVYDTVLPALTSMMEALENVTAKFASFMATIFGTTASKAQEDAEALKEQADAIEDTGKAAKKAEKEQKKYLASFDTIEKLGEKETEQEEEKKPGEAGFDTDFAQVQAPQWLLDFWKVFQDSWDQYGAATIQAFKDALQAIKDLLAAIGEAFMRIWTSGSGLELLNLLQQLLQLILGIIGDIATAFTNVWNSGAGEQFLSLVFQLLQTILNIIYDIAAAFREAWDNKGEQVIQALFYALDSVLQLIISIGESFREAWNDGSGVKIWETILDIVTNVLEIVGNLANRLREAWEFNGNGVAIWNVILDIFQDILDFLNEITDATAQWTSGLDLEPVVSAFRMLLEAIEPVVDIILDGLSWAWENILIPLATWVIEDMAPASIEMLAKAVQGLIPLLESIGNLFTSLWPIIQPIAKFLGNTLVIALKALGEAIEFVTELVSAFINLLAQMVSSISGAKVGVGNLNSFMGMDIRANDAREPILRTLNAYSMDDLPHLANGAVISPNSEFMAVLGDQRNGTNIETPLPLMKQAFKEALAESGGLGNGTDVNVNFGGSLAQLARILQPEITAETRRRGPSLVTGGVY